MPTVRINLIGEFQCLDKDGQVLDISAAKDQGVIAILTLSESHSCSRSRIIDLLWSDRSKEQALASVRQSLWSLKKVLGDSADSLLRVDRKKIGLNPGPVRTDIDEFRELIKSPESESLEKAVSLHRGDLLEGLVIQDRQWQEWLTRERENLRAGLAETLCTLIEHYTAEPDTHRLIDTGRRLIELDPYREEGHRAMMQGFADSNQKALALKQFERCSELLLQELKTAPSSETRELFTQIKEGATTPQSKEHRSISVDKPSEFEVPEQPFELPDRPSIAVLPFNNLSGDQEQEYFSDGITEDIITELSRFSSLFVVARNSSFQFRGKSVDIREVGRRLGVRFVLEGSVRTLGNRVRITGQLIDASSNDHVWADRYDGDLEDIFSLQDEISRSIVSTIVGRIDDFDTERITSKPTANLSAYENVLRGQKHMHRYTEDDFVEARQYFEHAISLDPGFARAHAWLAYVELHLWAWYLTPDRLDLAVGIGETALALDDHESKSHLALGVGHLFRAEHDKGEYHLVRATELNPNDDFIMIEYGRYLMYTNQPMEGAKIVRKAMRQNPYHPNWYWNVLGRCLHTAQHFGEAVSALERIRTPQFWNHAYLAACYSELGQSDKATKHLETVLSLRPDFTVSVFAKALPYKDAQVLREFMAGFERAGFPA
jgi:TolB-like protein/Tfp pilus assembly protein PilF